MILVFCLAKIFFGDDGFQIMFAYQPILNVLELQEDMGSAYKIGMRFNKSNLVVEQNNYANKIVNTSISYKLDYCPKITNNFN